MQTVVAFFFGLFSALKCSCSLRLSACLSTCRRHYICQYSCVRLILVLFFWLGSDDLTVIIWDTSADLTNTEGDDLGKWYTF